MTSQLTAAPSHHPSPLPAFETAAPPIRKARLIAKLLLPSLLASTLMPLEGCKGQKLNIGPSGGEVAGVIIGAAVIIGGTTAILVHESHAHHQVKGCVSSGANGLQIETADKKTWLLTGNTPNIQAGNLVKLHGNKIKQPRQATTAPTFDVEKIDKDFGTCKVSAASLAGAPSHDSAAGDR